MNGMSEYKRLLEQRLAEIEDKPILELYLTDDDVNWLKSINIILEKADG